MPVRFDAGHVPVSFELLQVRQDRPQFVIAGSDKALWKQSLIHWLTAERRGVPCLHEDCPWCPGPTRDYIYAPVLWYASASRAWKQGVLCLTEKMHGFKAEDHEGVIWEMFRRGRPNAPVQWQKSSANLRPCDFKGFDVVPTLMKVWGMYTQFRRRARRPGDATDSLYEPF